MKLAAMPSCLGGGELGTKHAPALPNRPLQVRLLPLQQIERTVSRASTRKCSGPYGE